jgi:predicted metal-dependent hydrolase
MNSNYTLKRSSRARRMRITVYPTGDVRVTAPRLVPEFVVRKFVAGKEDWITQKVAEFKARPVRRRTVQWGTDTRREYVAYKKHVLELASEKVRHFAEKYGVTFGTITIRNQKTRWGSCTKKGNLSFSYRIVFLPLELQNYLVVHEICHIKEFNHSRAFWDLVALQVPDYKVLRKRLKGIE